MATSAHCFYCFECLSASFSNKDAPSLERVEQLWEQQNESQLPSKNIGGEPESHDTDSALSSHDQEGEEDGEDGDGGEDEADAIHSPRPQHPSVSRLQAPTPISRSSNSSTPSVFSANSSNSQLTNATSIAPSPSPHPPPSYAPRLSLTDTFPLFVTWNTISKHSGNKHLRGCIGTFDPLPLATGLQTYALTSAFDDTRFSPISSSLMPSLSCSLTLLADFEPCDDAMDWTLGTHGLRISFMHRGRKHGATYLPDVAVEQGWSKEECLESLMRKAGWDGNDSGRGVARRLLRGSEGQGKPWEQVGDFRTIRYTGLKATADYAEWKEWRDWVSGQGIELS